MSKRTLLDKMRFLEALSADRRLSAIQLRVAIKLTSLYNDNYGYAWPSIATIASSVGAGRRSVFRAIEVLLALDWFDVESGGGRHRCNAYSPNFTRVSDAEGAEHGAEGETVSPVAPFGDNAPVRDDETVPSRAETVPSRAETVSPVAETVSPVAPHPLYNPPHKNPSTHTAYAVPPPAGAGAPSEGMFDDAWNAIAANAAAAEEPQQTNWPSKGAAADPDGEADREPTAAERSAYTQPDRGACVWTSEDHKRTLELIRRNNARRKIAERLERDCGLEYREAAARLVELDATTSNDLADRQDRGDLDDGALRAAFGLAPATQPDIDAVLRFRDPRKRGAGLATIRLCAGRSYDDIAAVLKIPPEAVRDIEDGTTDLSGPQRRALRRHYHVNGSASL